MTTPNYEHHPNPRVCFCGKPMIKKGYGLYPYPCKAQDRYPQAVVYQGCTAGHTGWNYDQADTQPTEIIESDAHPGGEYPGSVMNGTCPKCGNPTEIMRDYRTDNTERMYSTCESCGHYKEIILDHNETIGFTIDSYTRLERGESRERNMFEAKPLYIAPTHAEALKAYLKERGITRKIKRGGDEICVTKVCVKDGRTSMDYRNGNCVQWYHFAQEG